MEKTPRIAVTPGEPAGVGPDLVVQLAQQAHPAQIVVVADPDVLRERALRLGLPLELVRLAPGSAAAPTRAGQLTVLPVHASAPVRCGKLDTAHAAYTLRTLEKAVDGCNRGLFQALVTGPIHKGVINEAGIPFTGHTEFLAEQTGGSPVMMLVSSGLRVGLATTHVPLAAVPAALTRDRLTRVIGILHEDLRRRFQLEAPRIRICGLNPHAGEDGHLGREELEVIGPAMAALRRAGMDLEGPVPADTAFLPDSLHAVDTVLAMYHDQGLPVLKHAGFGRAVNVTLGLPIIRTSVDHGTALALAGTGRADAGSLSAALALAIEMAANTELREACGTARSTSAHM